MTGADREDDGRGTRALVPVDRRHVILERVADEQTIHVGALARELGVSEMTIRRDIRLLERDGFLRQTYGGATAHLTRSLDVAFNARALRHPREKRLIGMRAAEMVGDARMLYVGIGTTAEQFARYLPARPDLSAVTASLTTASLLGTRPIRVVALGGVVLQDELTCVGPIGRHDDRTISLRPGRDRGGRVLGSLGHHRADRRRSRGPAGSPGTSRAGHRHRRRLEDRRRHSVDRRSR